MAYVEPQVRKRVGTRYIVRWRGKGPDGKPTTPTEYFDDPESAEKFRKLVDAHGQDWPPGWIRGQGFVAAQRPRETMFEPFALAYIERLTGVQGDTRSKYRKDIQANLVPWFGPYSVADGEGGITRAMVQDWVNDLRAGRLAPLDPHDRKPRTAYAVKTVHDKHGLLSAILQAAVDAEPSLRASNPCTGTRLPRLDGDQDEEDMTFLEREEWAWIYECLADDAKDLAELMAETGLRWGEATALQPRDLRRRNGRPAIRVQRTWKKDEDGKSVLGAPKTKRSRRTLVISHRLGEKLGGRAKGLARDALLYTGPEGGKWDPGTFRRLRWIPAIELAAAKYGLIKRPRIHDIRHSHASWLIAHRVPLPAIQARLGHESITTTVDRYGHLLDALDDEVVAAVDWAMDPTAALPGFLVESGLADATEGLPRVPRQTSGWNREGWTDAGDSQVEGQGGAVHVVTLMGREVPFTFREDAEEVATRWNEDRAEQLAAMRKDGVAEEVIAFHEAAGPEERDQWTGTSPVWDRVPARRFVHSALAAYEPDGTLAYKAPPVSGRWVWEFEQDSFTTRPAEFRTERRHGGRVEAYVRGTEEAAVVRAVEQARVKALTTR